MSAAAAPAPSSSAAPAPGSGGGGSSASPFLTEIPSSLKQLSRLVVRGFYLLEDALVIDMLVRYPCLREDDLAELLKFDKKMLRAKMAGLRNDKFVQVKQRMETDEEGKVVKMNCYFINYKIFVNIVKYKLDHMRKKMETSERDQTSRSSFRCSGCDKTFTDLEADQLFDPQTMEFRCTYCSSSVEEDEAAGPQKDSRQLLARFNTQMEKLYDLLRAVEKIQLAPSVLEPEPTELNFGKDGDGGAAGRNGAGGRLGPADGEGKWSGEASRTGGFRTDDQQVNITFGESAQKTQAKREVPVWITESAVNDDSNSMPAQMSAASSPGGAGGAGGSGAGDDDDDMRNDDEITSLLLRHEKRGGGAGGQEKALIPGAPRDSDSDKSDDSDMDDVEISASLGMPTQSSMSAADVGDDAAGVMSDDDDDDGMDGDVPTVRVGGDEIKVTDVNSDVITRMTKTEKERYTQVYQDYYSHMYD